MSGIDIYIHSDTFANRFPRQKRARQRYACSSHGAVQAGRTTTFALIEESIWQISGKDQ